MKWHYKSENEQQFLKNSKVITKSDLNSRKSNPRKNHCSSLLCFLIIMTFIPLVFNLTIKAKGIAHSLNQLHSNQITIKIQGTGTQSILYEEYYLCPDEVYLNDDSTNIVGSDCHLVNIPSTNTEINTLKLIWNTVATSLYRIFEEMENLLEVDMSSYDTSSVNDMHQMFYGCSLLTSINLSNLKTSLVTSMRLMFSNCSSLNELDVSSFDTSNVVDMHFMFSGLSKLISLDVSNFNTHNVEIMEGMFDKMVQQ